MATELAADMATELAAEEVPEMVKCLSRLNGELDNMNKLALSLKEQVAAQEYSSKEGVDLLGLKNQLLLSYLSGLSGVAMVKTEGVRAVSLDQTAIVSRLVEDRVVLEKLRPLESKFKYQLDKILRTASSGLTGGEHPLQFRPAPQNLVSKTTSRPAPVDHTHMSQEESNESDTEGQIYVPPRVQAMPYKEEVEKLPVKLKSEKHKLLRELRNEWAELPAEFQTNELEAHDGHADRPLRNKVGVATSGGVSEGENDRQRYEENFMMRLPGGRKRERQGGHSRKGRALTSITDFSMFRSITRQGRRSRRKVKKLKK